MWTTLSAVHRLVFLKEQIRNHLDACKFAFVRVNLVRRLLQHPYERPCEVVQRQAKHFTIKENGNISVDRINLLL